MMAASESVGPDGVSKEFDPRFSRAFQPGYDPRVHREAPPTALQREEPRSYSAQETREPDSIVGSLGFAESDSGADEKASLGADRGAEINAGRDAAADDRLAPVVWWRRVNPWFVVLWALGLAFIGAGIAVVFAINDATQNNGMNGYDSYVVSVLFQMGWVGVPMLFVLGLATLTSTVVIQAALWHRP